MDDKQSRLVNPKPQKDDKIDLALRPKFLIDLIGQERIKENLAILIDAARQRGEPLDHVLFYGPPGLGKTTLAHILANEMNVNIKITSGPAIERQGDLAAILTNLRSGDVLFIDEVHRLGKSIEGFRTGYRHRQRSFGALYPLEFTAFHGDWGDHAIGIGNRATARSFRRRLSFGFLRCPCNAKNC
jgi:hypothetical protein